MNSRPALTVFQVTAQVHPDKHVNQKKKKKSPGPVAPKGLNGQISVVFGVFFIVNCFPAEVLRLRPREVPEEPFWGDTVRV